MIDRARRAFIAALAEAEPAFASFTRRAGRLLRTTAESLYSARMERAYMRLAPTRCPDNRR